MSPPLQDIFTGILTSLAVLVSEPYSRKYVSPSSVFSVLFACFTGFQGEGSAVGNEHRAQWAAARHIIVVLSRTWAVRFVYTVTFAVVGLQCEFV